MALAVTLITLLAPAPANAVPTSVSLSPSNPTKGAAGDVLTWNWTGYTNATVKCVKVQYSVNADGTGGIPAGMVVSGTTFAGTYLSGQTFAATDTNAATGTVVYSNATGVAAGTGAKSFTITSITNSSASNAYVGVTTYDVLNRLVPAPAQLSTQQLLLPWPSPTTPKLPSPLTQPSPSQSSADPRLATALVLVSSPLPLTRLLSATLVLVFGLTPLRTSTLRPTLVADTLSTSNRRLLRPT